MNKVLIFGLYKPDVLLALYNNARYGGIDYASSQTMQVLGRMSRNASPEKAVQLIAEASEEGRTYFGTVDLGEGPRLLNVDLSDFEFNAEEFDKAHGEGQAANAINALRDAFGKVVDANPEPSGFFKAISGITKSVIIAQKQQPEILESGDLDVASFSSSDKNLKRKMDENVLEQPKAILFDLNNSSKKIKNKDSIHPRRKGTRIAAKKNKGN